MEKGTENTRDPDWHYCGGSGGGDKDQRTFTRIWGIYHRQNGDTLS